MAEGDFRGENIRNDPFSIFPLVGDDYPAFAGVGYAVGIHFFVGIPVNGFAAARPEKGQWEGMMKAFAFRTGGFLWKVAVEVAVMRVGDGFRGGIVFSLGMIALQNNLIDSAPDVKAGNQIERKEGGQDNQNNAEWSSTFHGGTLLCGFLSG